MNIASEFLGQVVGSFLSVVTSLTVGAIGYLSAIRYERGKLAFAELIYLERLTNIYSNHVYTVHLSLNRLVNALKRDKCHYVSFQKMPVRYDALMNLLDIALINDWLPICIDFERLNKDLEMLEKHTERVYGFFQNDLNLENFRTNASNIIQQANELEGALQIIDKKIMIFLAKLRITITKWRDVCGSDQPKSKRWILHWNYFKHSTFSLSEEAISKEMEELKKERGQSTRTPWS